jgi:hypothetical protein
MRTWSIVSAAALVLLSLSGCASTEGPASTNSAGGIVQTVGTVVPGYAGVPVNETPLFSVPQLIDTVRAGGEPVIAILPSGTILVSAHPGWTHYHPSEDPTHPGSELVTPANIQSYLWRSTDGGETWSHVNLAGLPVDNLPRSTAIGVSDPEWTVMEDGTICGTDLIALASSSTSCSHDDGVTWFTNGNPVAAGGVNDRQWLASHGEEFYFTANYFVDHHIRASTDYGLTWEDRGDVPCSGDLIANPSNGHLIAACTAGVAVSEDAGWTWEVRSVPETDANNNSLPRGGQRIMAEPAIDAAGNTWIVWTEGERRMWIAGSPDEGQTYPWVHEITPHFNLYSRAMPIDVADFGSASKYSEEHGTNGSYIWPWISAGSDGRVAVSWIGGFSETRSAAYNDPWFLFTAYVLDANNATPSVSVNALTPTPIHYGPICQSGTTCQVTSVTGDDSGDRRMGDFFETTIDGEGFLHASVSDTFTRSDDVVSHPTYIRQTGGIRLITEEDMAAGWTATQG